MIMIKRYSINTEQIAKELILLIDNRELLYDNKGVEIEQGFNNITVTEKTHGIMIWGFEDKVTPILDEDNIPTFDKDGIPLVDVIKGTTYNVDVAWKGEQPTEWEQYEINPLTPNHTVL